MSEREERRPWRILHLGLGAVGREFLGLVLQNRSRLAAEWNLGLEYLGFFSSSGGVVASRDWTELELQRLLSVGGAAECMHAAKSSLASQYFAYYAGPGELLLQDRFWEEIVIVDTSAADTLYPFVEQALARGAHLVTANKKLLAGPQEEYTHLSRFGPTKLRCETTVGAGLPIIGTLRALLASGDDIGEITGGMSGTLGAICGWLEDGIAFSQAVADAEQRGYTEPDPRVDLSGMDVARKALILARIAGLTMQIGDVSVDALYPDWMITLPQSEFQRRLPELDPMYAAKMERARKRGNTLRYVARVTLGGSSGSSSSSGSSGTRVGLMEVPVASAMGQLRGPENLFEFKTGRYLEYPLIVRGPGAGRQVTAAGVLADLLGAAGIC